MHNSGIPVPSGTMRFTVLCVATRPGYRFGTMTIALQELTTAAQQYSELFVSRAMPSAGLTIALALSAWGLRAVTLEGAIAGALLTFILCMAAGPISLFAVFSVFVLTFIATRMGEPRKRALGLAEAHDGRGARQMFANLGAAACCALPLIFIPKTPHGLLVGAAAALAEAAADTVSSEIGQAFAGKPVLITNLRHVQSGTNGGVTALGSAAGIAAAAIVGAVCVWTQLTSQHWYPLVVVAATAGMFFDSLLGATLERPGRIGNNSVNFASTTIAALIALAVWFFMTLRFS